MARPLRSDPLDGWHHLMNRGASRGNIFVDDNDRTSFGQQLADMHEHFGVVVHAYCLMDNHFHLLVNCPSAGLSDAMQRFSSTYTRHLNDRHGRDGALFRGRFHSRLITDEAHVINACRYIHRNALDISGIDDVARYRWSSHRTYLGFRRCPPWLETEFVLDRFGGQADAFDRFVRSADASGSCARDRATIQSLCDAVRLVLVEVTATTDADLSTTVRMATLAALDRLGGFDPEVVAGVLGIPSRGAYRTAVSRARAAARRRSEISSAVERALTLAGWAVTSGV
jgi:REP element-mobilizing transposase RayT